MILFLKLVHVATLLIWCAGLLGLPALIAGHQDGHDQQSFSELRRFVRMLYVRILTPAAVIAVASGTALIFARDVFTGWMVLKLALVALMVALHAFEGQLLLESATGELKTPASTDHALVFGNSALILAILLIVLAKPVVDEALFPDWLLAPRDNQLSLDTPI